MFYKCMHLSLGFSKIIYSEIFMVKNPGSCLYGSDYDSCIAEGKSKNKGNNVLSAYFAITVVYRL